MNTETRGSAQIYQFPARSRAAVSARGENGEAVARRAAEHVGATVLGACWYHEEAIGESAAPTKP